MRIKIGTLFVATIASVALISCASFRSFTPATPCAGPECAINVTVASNGAFCQAGAIPDIDASFAGEHKITWRMTTPGYEFSREPYKFGIFIKDDPDDDFNSADSYICNSISACISA